ncbi:hypothetical protein QVD99_001206 [Batrachochytrium dendrobatidis]|nr:hypothetical protein O5D80_000999 [Batrachochytrium dendrobatidis]KAK5672444.1 hypothetical protein QVD99_001206 [Batrachochytrium dendrobatidis]
MDSQVSTIKGVKKIEATKKQPHAGGAFIRNILKKNTKGTGEIQIKELDESVLKKRLVKLDQELEDYKAKCAKYKKENDWYREEIETCQKDTADYIMYLESKKNEKLDAIQRLTESNQKDMDMYLLKRKKREEENQAKISEFHDQLVDFEMKLAAKETEIMQLSDTMARRTKHEGEMANIRKEMQNAELNHLTEMADLERSLLEARMKLQKEAENKIKSMESAAHEKAAKYLTDHTTALEAENSRLSQDLRKVTLATQQQIAHIECLERENRELEREQRLRHDLVKIRLKKIVEAQELDARYKNKQKYLHASRNKQIVANALYNKGLSALGSPLKMNKVHSLQVSDDTEINSSSKKSTGYGNRSTTEPQSTKAILNLNKELHSKTPCIEAKPHYTGNNPSLKTISSKDKNNDASTAQNKHYAVDLIDMQHHDSLWFEDDEDDEYQ